MSLRLDPLAKFDYLIIDSGIRKAIDEGLIQGSFSDDQIQPATLDVRNLKIRLYDAQVQKKILQDQPPITASFKEQFEFMENHERWKEYAKVFEGYIDQPITIPSGAYFEVFTDLKYFDERVFSASIDLRSSRGRLSLSLDQMSFLQDDDLSLYLPVHNKNSVDVTLYGGDKFAQVFFQPHTKDCAQGEVVVDPDEAYELAKQVFVVMPPMFGSYVVFQAGDSLNRFKPSLGIIDTKNKPDKDAAYEKLSLEKEVLLSPGDATVVGLEPAMKIPDDLGIQILHDLPYAQVPGFMVPNADFFSIRNSSCKAGWIDPGYRGKVTAHPTIRRPIILKKGFPLAFGRFFKYYNSVNREYGSKDLGSHYQGSSGDVSRS